VRSEAFGSVAFAVPAQQMLEADERQTLARLRPPTVRRDYLAAHVLARAMLAELAKCDPSQLHIHAARWKRPELVAPAHAQALRFSLSHADGIALCAVVAGCEVGADVESLRNLGPDPLGIAGVVCTPSELRKLHSLPRSAQAECLIALWTAKEAVAKATGLGFSLPFTRLAIGKHCKRAWLDLDSEAAGAVQNWRLIPLRLTPNHMAAIALPGTTHGRITIRLEEVVSMGNHGTTDVILGY
jgi:4'-phosphopantetheinyl transferase